LQQPPGILPGFNAWRFIALAVLLSGCAAGRWTLAPAPEIDRATGDVVSATYRTQVKQLPTPEMPVLVFNLSEIRQVSYSQRLVKERHFQWYRIPPSVWITGFASAGMLTALRYGWISATAAPHPALYSIAAFSMFGGAATQLKPAGALIPTGERRLLKTIGTTVLTDTVASVSIGEIPLRFEAEHPVIGTVTLNQSWAKGLFQVSLPALADWPVLEGTDPGLLKITIRTGEVTDSMTIALKTFMRGFVEITRPKTVLYIKPVRMASASLTELSPPSRLPLLKEENEDWYQVKYGITPGYVDKRRVKQVWLLSPEQTVASLVGETVPFGRIDIEREVPSRWKHETNAVAVAIGRAVPVSKDRVRHMDRDIKLFALYATDFMGLSPNFVVELTDSTKPVLTEWNEKVIRPEKDVDAMYVYLHGAWRVRGNRLFMYGKTATLEQPLDSLISWIDRYPAKKKVLIAEMDADSLSRGFTFSPDLFGNLTAEGKSSAVFLSTSPGQVTLGYRDPRLGVDKMHGLFTYLFFNGLRLGYHQVDPLRRYLETDVLYFSRRFRDRAQTPFIYSTIPSILPYHHE
jgi:hypothetical protein